MSTASPQLPSIHRYKYKYRIKDQWTFVKSCTIYPKKYNPCLLNNIQYYSIFIVVTLYYYILYYSSTSLRLPFMFSPKVLLSDRLIRSIHLLFY